MDKSIFNFAYFRLDCSMDTDFLDSQRDQERTEYTLREWLLHQLVDINVIAIIIIFTFVTAMSKMNTQKLLKEQSQEIYNQVEQIKAEIWRASGSNTQ